MRTSNLLLSAVLFCAPAAMAQHVDSIDWDPAADFTKFHTYTITEGTKAPNELAQKRIDAALAAQMEAKGLTKATGEADLVVVPHCKVSKEQRIDVTGYGYRYPGWGMQTVNVTDVSVGTLVVDIVQSGTKAVVWRGIVSDTLPYSITPEKSEKLINKAVGKLFKKFPPPPKKQG